MKLRFHGTRGEIEKRTRRHRMHTSLMVSCRGADVMIDCGLDWLGKFDCLQPDAIVLTHSHPDHAWGLKNGARLVRCMRHKKPENTYWPFAGSHPGDLV